MISVSGAPLDRCGDLDREVDWHVDRPLIPKHNLGSGVTRKKHMNACPLEPAGGRRVVRR
jgi:hypothetical protein